MIIYFVNKSSVDQSEAQMQAHDIAIKAFGYHAFHIAFYRLSI